LSVRLGNPNSRCIVPFTPESALEESFHIVVDYRANCTSCFGQGGFGGECAGATADKSNLASEFSWVVGLETIQQVIIDEEVYIANSQHHIQYLPPESKDLKEYLRR